MEKLNPREINTTALAFLGDAVYEVYIRKHIMDFGEQNADRLHRMAVRYVRADGQAKAVKALMDGFLSEDETSSKARSADAVTYKLATAFEALIGYLYLGGQKERLSAIMRQAVKEIEK